PTTPPSGQPTDGSSAHPTNPGSGTGGTGNDGSGTCPVDTDGSGCADNTDTDSAGAQPVQQSKPKEELAETGASETTFLVVGAATMIAGGVGFRLLPRLINRPAAAA
ncbi:hypothetical protein AAHZ94_34855, partial [Streptomyces sp. HSW2009]